ncbi:MAG: RHS repeat-associated core domain-containing protein [Opitutales bacterium]
MYTVTNWSNRDPIQEQGGLNLYAMVQNNPLNFADLLGLDLLKNPFSRERNEQYNDLLKELKIR